MAGSTSQRYGVWSEQARALLRDHVVIDAHNDLLALKVSQQRPLDLLRRTRQYHTDAVRLREVGVTASFFTVGGNQPVELLATIEQTQRALDAHEELLAIRHAADIRRAQRLGALGIMMICEGAMALQERLEMVELLFRLGVREIGLTHGQGGVPFALQGSWSYFGYCDAADRTSFRRTCKGLTEFGGKVVKEMNRLGMLVDLSHINDAAFFEVLELAEQPVVASHGGVFGCCPHSRNLTDEQLDALAQVDGVLGIAFFHKFLDEKRATIERIVDQIAYVADRVGIAHVGLGSDFDGLPPGVKPVVAHPGQLVDLVAAMLARGFTRRNIKAVLGGNFLRVLSKVLPK